MMMTPPERMAFFAGSHMICKDRQEDLWGLENSRIVQSRGYRTHPLPEHVIGRVLFSAAPTFRGGRARM